MVKVLVSDKLAAEGLEVLRQARGIEVIERPGMTPSELLEAIRDVDGLAIRSGTTVTAEVIAAADKLRVIGRAGIGVDNVDVSAATDRGIAVLNTPEGNNITTAEHAIALLVALARHIPQATASMKAGKWEKEKFQGMELFNRTLAVVGLGNIGRIVALRGKALGMKVIAYDPFMTLERAQKLDIELVADFDEVLARADAITVHVPKTKDTIGLLNRETFAKARKGLLVINAARGGIVDEEALLEALESGQVGGAGLDVFVEEPPPPDHPLLRHERVICTPHLGASTEQAQINVSVAVAEQICDYLLNGIVRNAINVPSISPELLSEVGPYLRLAEKLGRFQGQLCPGAIEQVEVEYAGEVSDLNVAPITIAVLKGILRNRPAIGSHPLFPSMLDSAVPVTYRVAAKWLKEAEKLADLAPLKNALWHAYRRKWASERKHLPQADVAEMGGWSCVETLAIYQRPDAETRQLVLTDRRPIREIS